MGCSQQSNANIGDSEFPPLTDGFILLEGNEYPLEMSGYSWERKKGSETEVVTTDHLSPYQMADQAEPLISAPNKKGEIKINGDPEITVYVWNENGREAEVETNANQIVLPSIQGKYIYEVFAEWKDGHISYTFVTEIK